MAGDITVKGVHIPGALGNLSIRGWGEKKKKKLKSLSDKFNKGYIRIKEIKRRITP